MYSCAFLCISRTPLSLLLVTVCFMTRRILPNTMPTSVNIKCHEYKNVSFIVLISSLTRLVFDWKVNVDCSCGQTAVCSMTCFPQSILHFTECTACRDAALQSVKALNSQTLIWANAQNAAWSIFNVRQRPFDPRKPQSSPPKLIWANRRKVRGGNQIKSRRSEDFYNTWAKHLAFAYFQFFGQFWDLKK